MPHRAHLRAEAVFARARHPPGRRTIGEALVVIVIAPADAQLDSLGDADLVLAVDPGRLLHLDAVGERGGGGQREAAIDRIEDVDGLQLLLGRVARKARRADPQEHLIILEAIGIRADQHAVGDITGSEIARQFGAGDEIGRVIIAQPALAGERAAVAQQALAAAGELGLGRGSEQRGVAVIDPDQRAPAIGEIVLQFDLVAEHLGNVRALARLAEEAAARDHAKLAVHCHNAAIEGDFLTGIFELVDDAGRLAELDRNRGHEAVALAFDRVAERACILVEADKAHADGIAERGLEIGIGAVCVEGASQQPHLASAFELGALGDEVDRPARFAAPEQRRARAFEDFHRLDPGQIARSGKAAPGVEAVDKVIARQVFIAHEAAHREGVPQPAEIVLPRDRGRQIERGVQIERIDVAQLLRADHLFGLRDFQLVELAAIGWAGAGDDDLSGWRGFGLGCCSDLLGSERSGDRKERDAGQRGSKQGALAVHDGSGSEEGGCPLCAERSAPSQPMNETLSHCILPARAPVNGAASLSL